MNPYSSITPTSQATTIPYAHLNTSYDDEPIQDSSYQEEINPMYQSRDPNIESNHNRKPVMNNLQTSSEYQEHSMDNPLVSPGAKNLNIEVDPVVQQYMSLNGQSQAISQYPSNSKIKHRTNESRDQQPQMYTEPNHAR